MENFALDSWASSALTSEVLPAPEGAAITYKCPAGCPGAAEDIALFHVLDLFAHLLDHHFQLDGGAGGVGILRFGDSVSTRD
jgi:hypothetical protein